MVIFVRKFSTINFDSYYNNFNSIRLVIYRFEQISSIGNLISIFIDQSILIYFHVSTQNI